MAPDRARSAACPRARSRPPSSSSSAPCSASQADALAALQQLDPLWDELFPAEQARIVTLLVESVDIGTDVLHVRLRVDGLNGLTREMLADDVGQAA